MKKLLSIVMIMVVVMTLMPINAVVVEAAENSKPSISVSAPSIKDVKQGGTVTFTVNIVNADKIDFDENDVGIAGAGVTAQKKVTGTGNIRTVILSNVQGPVGTIFSIAIRGGIASNAHGVSAQTPNSYGVKILAGDTSTQNPSGTEDVSRPSVVVTNPSSSTVMEGGSIEYTFKYFDNRAVTSITLSPSDIILNGFTANISIKANGTDRTVVLSNIHGTAGNKYISLKAGTASDLAGNKALGIDRTQSFRLITDLKDTVAPVMSISGPSAMTVNKGGVVSYIVRYQDNIGISAVTLKNSDIKLNGFTANITITGTGNERVITLSNINGEVGNKTITISSATAVDAAGNKANGATSSAFELKLNDNNDNNNNNNNDNNNNNNNNNGGNNKPGDWVENPDTGKIF